MPNIRAPPVSNSTVWTAAPCHFERASQAACRWLPVGKPITSAVCVLSAGSWMQWQTGGSACSWRCRACSAATYLTSAQTPAATSSMPAAGCVLCISHDCISPVQFTWLDFAWRSSHLRTTKHAHSSNLFRRLFLLFSRNNCWTFKSFEDSLATCDCDLQLCCEPVATLLRRGRHSGRRGSGWYRAPGQWTTWMLHWTR